MGVHLRFSREEEKSTPEFIKNSVSTTKLPLSIIHTDWNCGMALSSISTRPLNSPFFTTGQMYNLPTHAFSNEGPTILWWAR